MGHWVRGLLSVLAAVGLIACFFGVLAALVFGYSPNSPLSAGNLAVPLIASAAGMVLSGAALWALGRRPEGSDPT
ncbi:hypothetical protein [Deinococcus budaensis]|uniref:Uncharacterized protein n=1 Tax=Deinococcus budaensis TaxID=1665626 RepID=A0A7W8GCZ2_9DEIO|nr:hypothetical protein [Deinococcus budaensis]MBB5233276.1 hypothetical protein [Deinococcus budaensis]